MTNHFSTILILFFLIIFLSSFVIALPTVSQQKIDPNRMAEVGISPPLFVTVIDSKPIIVANWYRFDDTVLSPLKSEIVKVEPMINRGSVGSSLTINEMRIVMGGGRNWDPFSKEWGYRDSMRGIRRTNFLLSWEANRKRSRVNQLIPIDELYSST